MQKLVGKVIVLQVKKKTVTIEVLSVSDLGFSFGDDDGQKILNTAFIHYKSCLDARGIAQALSKSDQADSMIKSDDKLFVVGTESLWGMVRNSDHSITIYPTIVARRFESYEKLVFVRE